MFCQSAKVDSAQKIAEYLFRCKVGNSAFIPPLGHALRRVRRRARELCLGGRGCIQSATQAIKEIHAEDFLCLRALILSTVRSCSAKFRISTDELMNDALVRVGPTLPWKFKRTCSRGDTRRKCLQRYCSRVVFRTALRLRFGKTTRRMCRAPDPDSPDPNGTSYVVTTRSREVGYGDWVNEISDPVEILSQYHACDEFEALLKKMRDNTDRERLWAIYVCETLKEAAWLLGIDYRTLRQWVSQLRRRLAKWRDN